MLLWVSHGGTGRQQQLQQSILETFLAECDYRLGEGKQECSAQPDPPAQCVHGKKIRIMTPLTSSGHPSQPFSRVPTRTPRGCTRLPPRVTHRPGTRTSAAADPLLHKKSASLRQDGAVQNYPVTGQKLLQCLVSIDFLYVQLCTPTLARVRLPRAQWDGVGGTQTAAEVAPRRGAGA